MLKSIRLFDKIVTLFVFLLTNAPHSLLRLIAKLSSGIIAGLCLLRYQVALQNLQAALPDTSFKQRQQLARSSIYHGILTLLEAPHIWQAAALQADRFAISVSDNERLKTLKREGRPLVLVSPHLGQMEVLAGWAGIMVPITQMYAPQKNASIDNAISKGRGKYSPVTLVTNDISGIRAYSKALHANSTISAISDQEPAGKDGIFAPFFGIDALSNRVIPRLIQKGQCDVVVCAALRGKKPWQYRFEYMPLQTDMWRNSLEDIAAQLNLQLEQLIRRCPEQYLWAYKRFRTRPPGASAFYRFELPWLQKIFTKALLNLRGAWLRCDEVKKMSTRAQHWIRLSRYPGRRGRRDIKRHLAVTPKLDKSGPAVKRIAAYRCLSETLDWQVKDEAANRLLDESLISASVKTDLSQGGQLILAPPFISRATLILYLATEIQLDYLWYPPKHPLVRRQLERDFAARQVGLFEYCTEGYEAAHSRRLAGRNLVICPDQQPALDTGSFVEFFGVRKYVADIIAHWVLANPQKVLWAILVVEQNKLRLLVEPLQLEGADSVHAVWRKLLDTLEQQVGTYIEQFDWLDRRYNIRPPGEAKFY